MRKILAFAPTQDNSLSVFGEIVAESENLFLIKVIVSYNEGYINSFYHLVCTNGIKSIVLEWNDDLTKDILAVDQQSKAFFIQNIQNEISKKPGFFKRLFLK